jgi:dolichol-phosphate mannosyltransferase
MLSVVVPTRNEALNVETLVGRLGAALNELGKDWELLFVDDSDDQTPEVVRGVSGLAFPVRLLHREPGERAGGLGGAVQRGFAEALGGVIVVMDGDLQHPPEVLPALVAPVMAGEVELAAGSRYGRGGKNDGLSGPWRHLVSRACCWLVHCLVPRSRQLEDPLSGLFAFRRSVIEGVPLRPDGYKILLEVAVRGNWRSARNVPFTFAARHAGASKASVVVGLVFLRHLGRLVLSRGQVASLAPGVVDGLAGKGLEGTALPQASPAADAHVELLLQP